MAFLRHTVLFALSLWLIHQQNLSPQVERVEPPTHPVNTLAMGVVVAEIEIGRTTGETQTRVLCGEPPFVSSALKALEQWQFVVHPKTDIGRTSVTFLFRPPTIHSVKIGARAIWPWNLEKDYPALPQQIIDPGYPPTSLATGAAILEVQVNASGIVTGTRPLAGTTPLTDRIQEVVKNWRFSPARTSGKAAPSTVFVVVSFVLPT